MKITKKLDESDRKAKNAQPLKKGFSLATQ